MNKAFRDRNRKSQFFNHLSAVSEGTEALLWVGAVRTKFSLYFFNFQIFVFNEVISRGASHMKVAGMLAEILDLLRDQSGRGPTFFDL